MKFLKTFGKVMAFIGVFIGIVLATLYTTLLLICYGPSENAKSIFIPTLLETGKLKFVVNLVMSKNQIQEIVNSNSLQEMNITQDDDLIKVGEVNNNIEVEEVIGTNFGGKMMIIHDPSRVSVATTYPFSEYGKTLDEIIKENNAVAGVNGGLYVSTANKGGYPMGAVISDGKIVWNRPYGTGYHFIGFDTNNVLKIVDISHMSAAQFTEYAEAEHLRDGVTFQEEASDANNHFVKLIINGEKRLVNGLGSGLNPRTAIGQREDGTILILVTDGRGANGHLGASAQDLIDVMEEYGAINAANIDGGSSSCMYYNDEYLMTSVTFYYSNSSWRLPEAFIIK